MSEIRLYLDTSVILAAVIERGGQYERARMYCERLVAEQTVVIVSELVLVEIAQAAKSIPNDPSALPLSERRRRRLHRWGDLYDVRNEWYQYLFEGYDDLMSQFWSVEEYPIDRKFIDVARDFMVVFQVDSHDALHAATAVSAGASVLATLDKDFVKFSRVPDLMIHLVR